MMLKTENIGGKTICMVQSSKENVREFLFICDNKPLFQYVLNYNTNDEMIIIDRDNYCHYKELIFKLFSLHFGIASIDIIDLIKQQEVDGYYIIFDYLTSLIPADFFIKNMLTTI